MKQDFSIIHALAKRKLDIFLSSFFTFVFFFTGGFFSPFFFNKVYSYQTQQGMILWIFLFVLFVILAYVLFEGLSWFFIIKKVSRKTVVSFILRSAFFIIVFFILFVVEKLSKLNYFFAAYFLLAYFAALSYSTLSKSPFKAIVYFFKKNSLFLMAFLSICFLLVNELMDVFLLINNYLFLFVGVPLAFILIAASKFGVFAYFGKIK